MAIPEISQDAFDLTLSWYKGDPVSLQWTVDVNWAGTYTAAIYTDSDCTTQLAALTVTATWSSPKTTFTVAMSDAASDAVPAGIWFWKCRETAGLTRFAGAVQVNG